MRVLIRKTIAGSEYWDNEEKRNIFVPLGQEPDFEVVGNPQSMLKDGKNVVVCYDTTDQKDLSVNGKGEALDSDGNKEEDFDDQGPTTDPSQEDTNPLDELSVKQLREYAKKKDIEIPGAVRAKSDILNIIKESE